jgi:hypothetical protein
VTADGAPLGQCVNPAGVPQSGGVGFFSIGSPRTVLASVKYNF